MPTLGLAELVILGLLADGLFRRLGLPGLIGMLLVGVALGSSGLGLIDPRLLTLSGDLRQMALIVILLRVGFSLNLTTLRRVGMRVLLLAWIPASCEGLMITIVAQPLLGLNLLEAALLGSVLAAVSPAVVVPLMLRLTEERRGTAKGIPAMVMAAASLDDIAVIVVNGLLLGLLVQRQGDLPGQLVGLPLGLLLGAGAGALLGWGLIRWFERFRPNANRQVLIVLALALLLLRLQDHVSSMVPFTGLVAAIALGVVILELREEIAHPIAAKLGSIWVFAELVLFTLVGAQLNLSVAWSSGLAGLAVLALGLIARSAGTLACLARSTLSTGERLFVVAAYLPKATVQAAIGALPLMVIQAAGGPTTAGEVILAVAVLSIVTTAPLGAWLSAYLADRVLHPSVA
ncbi:cation:proton antiporter [Synechococcus sp. Cruz-9H2]|uniref:cation:proton antiporter domain-containing protein n=1 Tax=unclassified Synechococcus TaxID=2626047 RepID=UPI0020CE3866|nr:MULTISPECIES: cation:proton antiporter [unclassified Synechococcus]MCP9820899.1 cation:proton antiporter [Synechococcus sp. Cruz-9H2]MCP9845153.1 cation:proton antiporter [Synechococcus sp. Edmonson 11F2]MCP9857323.1 cation:proton antiporter [Synechococcus sp. Cruz-9C9]MCP9864550.1 cation:proton antiporter [Synechococcus sp. Cruz-7E5]MCP9871819.1 cation:proton antiporter [Synechococcus sp. Cruz-7B9]